MSQPQVRIHNPLARNGYTSLKSAQRYVARGRARWRKDGSLEFIESEADYRAVSVMRSEDGYDRDVSRGAMASLDAIKHLPVAGNVVKLITRHKRKAA